MRHLSRLSDHDSNQKIAEVIRSQKSFLIGRVGLGGDTAIAYTILSNRPLTQQFVYWIYNNNGWYGEPDFLRYSQMYGDACKNADLQAYWNFPGFQEMEDFLVPESKTLLEPGSLESFRFDDPWTKELKGKKILVIHPFKETIEKQLQIRDKIWQNQSVLPEAEYIVYQSVQSLGGVGPDNNWYGSYDRMCKEISEIDFDIALLGCGAYGLPLCNYIKMTLGKGSIYIGGGLQLYFGIKGKRWDESTDVTKFYNNYWTRPFDNERSVNSMNVENGCYW